MNGIIKISPKEMAYSEAKNWKVSEEKAFTNKFFNYNK
jgi:hypothetical protein